VHAISWCGVVEESEGDQCNEGEQQRGRKRRPWYHRSRQHEGKNRRNEEVITLGGKRTQLQWEEDDYGGRRKGKEGRERKTREEKREEDKRLRGRTTTRDNYLYTTTSHCLKSVTRRRHQPFNVMQDAYSTATATGIGILQFLLMPRSEAVYSQCSGVNEFSLLLRRGQYACRTSRE
jgi:hypothetical protein